MGICNECKHHRYTQLDLGRWRCGTRSAPQPSGHWCMNEKKQGTDYVTGEAFTPDCYRLNKFGECLDFEKAGGETEEGKTDSGASGETSESEGFQNVSEGSTGGGE